MKENFAYCCKRIKKCGILICNRHNLGLYKSIWQGFVLFLFYNNAIKSATTHFFFRSIIEETFIDFYTTAVP